MRYTEIKLSFPIVKFLELPSAERLRELFDYDVLRGELVWRESPASRTPAGSIAGCLSKKGYRQVRINSMPYKTHRLIWKWYYGTDPQGELDHRDQEDLQIKQNHIWHLRDLTGRERRTVTHAHYKGSSLPAGVHLNGKRYQATIKQDGKKIHLGTYDTPNEAHQTYLEALEIIESGGVVVSAARAQSSRYEGVTWHKRAQKWVAQPTVDGKQKYLGLFLTEIEAYQAVCKARSVT